MEIILFQYNGEIPFTVKYIPKRAKVMYIYRTDQHTNDGNDHLMFKLNVIHAVSKCYILH